MTAEAAAATPQWWVKPRLRTDEDEGRERRTSWLELFYDLVFVVIVSQLAHALALHPTAQGVASFVVLFTPAWWLWIGGTFYTERFEREDLSHRLFTFLQMLPIAALAVLVHDGTGSGAAAYALVYAAGRSLIVFLWLRGGYHDARARPMTTRYAAGFLVSIALFTVSAFVPAPHRFVLWIAGLAIDLVTPITTMRAQARLPRFSSHRVPERFGLFVLIVLGENVVSVISGAAAHEPFDPATGWTALVAMATTFGVWWLYFDIVASRKPRRGMANALLRSYLHLPLILGVTATAAATLVVLEDGGAHALPPGHRLLLCGAVAAVFATLAGLHTVLETKGQRGPEVAVRAGLLGAAAAAVALGLAGDGLPALAVMAGLLALHLVLITFGAVQWARGRLA